MTTFKRARALAGAAAVAALAGGCKNFLSTADAINNPNVPTSASSQQRLTAVETNFNLLETGDPARIIALFMNQFAGTDRQYSQLSLYQIDATSTDGAFATFYTGGGIIDLRAIEASSDAAGDSTTSGIARVLEAWEIGTAADWFGDVPYSTAFQPGVNATLDPQATIYTSVQALLDRGIQQLNSGAGTGPLAADLFYQGNRTNWIQAANTLKARYYLHTAERQGTNPADGTPAFDATAYQNALTAAAKGISVSANNLRAYQSASQTEQNLLFQFNTLRSGYVAPNAFLVSLMVARNDPRISTYFALPNNQTAYVGSASGGSGGPPANAALFNTTSGIGASNYRWTLISYAENQLILAEANYRLGNTAAAQTNYNNARTANGFTTTTALPAGAAGLQEIMTEKYVTLVQNPEVWNDYRRTCFPALTPNGASTARIPSRFFYAQTEQAANPNIPVPNAQPLRNANDPNPCFVGARQTSN